MKTKAKKLIIRTKREIFNDIKANHPSIFNGDGLDFNDLREYVIGDDSRFLDHITSAKKQKPYVRVFKEEKELNIVTISLFGGSMIFGTKVQKSTLLAQIISIIGVSALSYQDRFSAGIFTDKMHHFIKPSKKLFFVQKAIEDILSFEPLGKKIKSENLENEIKKYVKKKSIIFLIGDFYEYIDLKKLNTIHEIIVLIVRDRFEEELSPIDFINFTDATTLKSIDAKIDKNFIKKYKKKVELDVHKLYTMLKKDRVKFAKIYTDENPIKKLRKLFMSKR